MLAEAVIAAAVLMVVSVGTLTALDGSNRASAASRDRSSAAEVAAEQLARLRSTPVATLAAYAAEGTTDVEVRDSGQSFTVRRSIRVLRDSNGTPGCTGAVADGFLQVRVSVSWSNMGSAKPVVLQQLVAGGALRINDNTGGAVVVVRDAEAQPLTGVRVALSGTSGVSASSDDLGCAAFRSLPVGGYVVDVSSGGDLIGPSGATSERIAIDVAAQQFVTTETMLDRPGGVDVEVVTQAADGRIVLSDGGRLRASQAGMASGERVFASEAELEAAALFPFAAPYAVHTGGCATTAPGTTPAPAGAGAVGSAMITRGLRVPVRVFQPGLVTRFRSRGQYHANASVTFLAEDCADRVVRTTDLSGRLVDPGLPYGSWTACSVVNGRAYRTRPFASGDRGPATLDFTDPLAATVVAAC